MMMDSVHIKKNCMWNIVMEYADKDVLVKKKNLNGTVELLYFEGDGILYKKV